MTPEEHAAKIAEDWNKVVDYKVAQKIAGHIRARAKEMNNPPSDASK